MIRAAAIGAIGSGGSARLAEASAEFLFHLEARDDASAAAESRVTVHRGAILTGSTKVFSATHRDELVQAASRPTRPVVGGEMEGLG